MRAPSTLLNDGYLLDSINNMSSAEEQHQQQQLEQHDQQQQFDQAHHDQQLQDLHAHHHQQLHHDMQQQHGSGSSSLGGDQHAHAHHHHHNSDEFAPGQLETLMASTGLSHEQALALHGISVNAALQNLPGIIDPSEAGFPRPTVKRRKPVKWEAWEEKNLIEGVRRFGRGNWAQIRNTLEFNPCRTNVDLHDKWRVLTGERKRNRVPGERGQQAHDAQAAFVAAGGVPVGTAARLSNAEDGGASGSVEGDVNAHNAGGDDKNNHGLFALSSLLPPGLMVDGQVPMTNELLQSISNGEFFQQGLGAELTPEALEAFHAQVTEELMLQQRQLDAHHSHHGMDFGASASTVGTHQHEAFTATTLMSSNATSPAHTVSPPPARKRSKKSHNSASNAADDEIAHELLKLSEAAAAAAAVAAITDTTEVSSSPPNSKKQRASAGGKKAGKRGAMADAEDAAAFMAAEDQLAAEQEQY